MRALDAKQEMPASAIGLIIEPKQGEQKEGVISFSSLLKGLEETAKGSLDFHELLEGLENKESLDTLLKVPQDGVLEEEELQTKKSSKKSLIDLLAQGKESKSSSDILTSVEQKSADLDALNTLLKGDIAELDQDVSKSLSLAELKILAKDAKEYLKKQILSSEGFKRSEIKALPKTLQGLKQVAQKLGIDLSKITFEKLKLSQKDLSTETRGSKESQKVKFTPLFKAQKSTEISTEQIVQTKSQNFKTIEKQRNSKTNKNETLELLLQGKKSTQKMSTGLTSDFSVETAKVIVQAPKKEPLESLQRLLNPTQESSESIQDTKTALDPKSTSLHLTKADSFEVKLNEAKQMVKYLSQDVKQAIDDYKAPFTRVKVQLNPQQLGEVELTVVQRGKNLHVNLSSNNAAINTLAMNANDLKIQLQNNGINNASLHFNNNGQGGESANSGHSNPQQQNREHAQKEYNYFDQEEANEEVLSSLEIIVPHYA